MATITRTDENSRRSRLRFGLRTLFELIAMAAFILALVYVRKPAEQELGRYQLQVIEDRSNTFGSQQWVIDTVTGEVWRLDGGQ